MRKNNRYVYYRHPRTTAEKRANQEGWERPCRRPQHLPDTYDDIYPAHEKTWKNKRATQYHPGGRGKKHSVIVDANYTYEWDLSEYFKEHNIPYRIKQIRQSYMREFPIWKKVYQGMKPLYKLYHTKKDGQTVQTIKFYRYTENYTWIRTGSEWRSVSKIVAYRLTWWYDKDIGIGYILSQCRRRRQAIY